MPFELKVESRECPGCLVEISVLNPFDLSSINIDSFYLDKNGFSKRVIQVDYSTTALVKIGDSIRFSIFIKGGEHLKITLDQSETQFSGSLSKLNDALFSTDQTAIQFEKLDQKFILSLNVEAFFNRIDSLDVEFNAIVDNTSFNSERELETLVAIQRLRVLMYKYNYALMHYDFHIAKPNLPERFLSLNKIPDSPELIDLAPFDYGSLARMYLDMVIYPKFWPRTKSVDSTTLFYFRTDSLLRISNYSDGLEDLLRAVNIDRQMVPNGDKVVLDELLFSYQREIENPKYLEKLTAKYEKIYSLDEGNRAPNIIGYNSLNEKVELIDLIGKPIVIDVWATWCKPCLESLPEMKKIEEEYDSSEITFLYISVDTSRKVDKD